MDTHKKYNLSFLNENHSGVVIKGCSLTNKQDSSFVNLCYYLIQVQYPENIDEIILPEVNNILNGSVQDDVYFSLGSEELTIDSITTTIFDNDKTEIIPTNDFKSILEEYSAFLRTPPLNGSKI